VMPFAASSEIVQPNITSSITLSPPGSPASGRQVHDAAYQSFSIEFSYMADYGGNNSCGAINPMFHSC
jgi:hypothetical protein